MDAHGKHALEGWPPEIMAIHDRGDFAILSDDDLLKLGAFLKTHPKRLRGTFEEIRSGKLEPLKEALQRLRRIHEYNTSRSSSVEAKPDEARKLDGFRAAASKEKKQDN